MINEAYISGQIHKAIYRQDGKLYVLEAGEESNPIPIRAMDFNSFLLANPETELYKDLNWTFEHLQSILNKHIAKHDALDLFLTGMDTTYSHEIRKEAIEILAEDYYIDSEIRQFITNRVFGTSKPDIFDPQLGAKIAQEIGNKDLAKIYTDLSYANELIITVRDSFKKALVEHEQFLKNYNFSVLNKAFTDEGILSGFVVAKLTHDNNAFDGIIIKYAQKVKELGIGREAMFLAKMKELIEEKYPASDRKANHLYEEEIETETKPDFATEFHELINDFTGKTKRKQQSKKGVQIGKVVSASLESIAELIAWIKQQIHEGYLKEAERGIIRLIELQDVISDAKHLCKSLCDIAQCYQELGRTIEADLLANGAINVYQNDPVPRCILAENLRKSGKVNQALETYNETIVQFGNSVVARNGKAETLRALGRLKEALEAYDETITRFVDDVVARNGKAETLRELGCLNDALVLYDEILYVFGGNVVTKSGKAETLRELGRLNEALIIYNQIIVEPNSDIVARNGKAETLRALGQIDEALETYNETIRQFGNDVVALCGKAEALRALGRNQESLAHYNETLQIFPNSQFAKAGRFALMIHLGKDLDIIATQINIEKPTTKDNWVMYHMHCMLLLKQNKIDEAVTKLRYGVQNSVFSSKPYFTSALSFALIKKKEFSEARKWIKEIKTPSPIKAVLITHIFAAENNLAEARKQIAAILNSAFKKVKETSEYLSDRYNIVPDKHYHKGMKHAEMDKMIETLEFELLTSVSLN